MFFLFTILTAKYLRGRGRQRVCEVIPLLASKLCIDITTTNTKSFKRLNILMHKCIMVLVVVQRRRQDIREFNTYTEVVESNIASSLAGIYVKMNTVSE